MYFLCDFKGLDHGKKTKLWVSSYFHRAPAVGFSPAGQSLTFTLPFKSYCENTMKSATLLSFHDPKFTKY